MGVKTKICGICGASFECSGLWGCWCSKVTVSRDRLKRLSELSDDCVCPKCLVEAPLNSAHTPQPPVVGLGDAATSK